MDLFTIGSVGIDLLSQGTQMGMDATLGMISGGGTLAPMALRSFGGGAQEARQNGADLQQAVNYGMASAAVEVLTEKMFDGLAGLYGKGAADDIVEAAINKLTTDETARNALKIAAAAAGESFEEFVSGIVNPALKSLYNGKSIGENYSELEWKDILYDALIGGIMGGVGGTVDVVRDGADAKSKPRMSMEDFVNTESPVWNNVEYKDIDTQQRLMQEKHLEMVATGEVVTVPESATNEVAQSYPDLRHMKKSERNPILKQKIRELKENLREMLNGLKGAYEFEVNGYILEARLYDTGIKEVLEKITQEKAEMLTQSGEIFRKAQYLYSTPDYKKNTDIYRWNYFYTPVQIGDQIVGVRIAVRDVIEGQNHLPESQIYNWNIKENASLGGGQPGQMTSSLNASSDASSADALGGGEPGNMPNRSGASSATTGDNIPQPPDAVKFGESAPASYADAARETQQPGTRQPTSYADDLAHVNELLQNAALSPRDQAYIQEDIADAQRSCDAAMKMIADPSATSEERAQAVRRAIDALDYARQRINDLGLPATQLGVSTAQDALADIAEKMKAFLLE